MAAMEKVIGYGCIFVILLTQIHCEKMLPPEVVKEIQDHKDDVTKIIDYVLTGDGKHQAIEFLKNFTDTFGPRNTGSQALEDAIDYSKETLIQQGFENVVTENVTANKWTRNKESLMMLEPREREMSLLSLGSSVGTNGDMVGEVIVFKSFDELETMADSNLTAFTGKIVLYSQIWVDYSTTNKYRSTGASRAAKYGAMAALLRSVTDYSLYTPHTGQQNYNHSVSTREIPIAAITVEDAQLMQRYYERGITVKVRLNMKCVNEGEITTRNVIAELKGSSIPEEVVIIGGHIDSWDVGHGVMDDGGGVTVSWQALLNLKALNLIPKRTIRTVFWTAEEIGLVGAEQYYEAHKAENGSISIIMESDYGTFKPLGLGFSGTESARAIIREVLTLLAPINATGVGMDGAAPDITIWIENDNVPGAELMNANDKYFYYHHTNADSITMEDPDDLDLCAILWTVSAYVIANLADKLPREEIYDDVTPTTPAVSTPVTDCSSALHVHHFTMLVFALCCMIFSRKFA